MIYEAEKAEKEKIQAQMEEINQRLGQVLNTISVSSQNGVVHTAHKDISKTVDLQRYRNEIFNSDFPIDFLTILMNLFLFEQEVNGQAEEIRNLNMDRLALTRVLAKLRLSTK